MPIRLVTTPSDATSAHALVIRMCEESGYKSRPSTAAFAKLVLNRPEELAVFLAEDGKKPVGVCTLSRAFSPYQAEPYGIFKALYVVPEYRKAGVADALYKALQQEAKKRGFSQIEWYVYEDNTASLGFFAKQGLEAEERKLARFTLPTKRIKTVK